MTTNITTSPVVPHIDQSEKTDTNESENHLQKKPPPGQEPPAEAQNDGQQHNQQQAQSSQSHAFQEKYYSVNHPALGQPPFQPAGNDEEPLVPQVIAMPSVHYVTPQRQFTKTEQYQYYAPYRSTSLPHILPSYHFVPQYFYHHAPAPVPFQPQVHHPHKVMMGQQQLLSQSQQQQQQQDMQQQGSIKSEPVSAVFKKTCYKCGNLGHYAEECEFNERLCYNCKKPGHETSDCPLPRSTDLKQCYICRKIGHLQSNCPLRVTASPSGQSHHLALQQQQQQLQQQQQQQQFFQRPPPPTHAYYYPNYEPLRASSVSSLPTRNSYSAPGTASPTSVEIPQQQQQQQVSGQNNAWNTTFLRQRGVYLQNANYAFHQRQFFGGGNSNNSTGSATPPRNRVSRNRGNSVASGDVGGGARRRFSGSEEDPEQVTEKDPEPGQD